VIDAVRPGVNAAGEVPHMTEAGLVQKLHRLGATRPHLAHGNDVLVDIQFIHTARQFGKRDQVTARADAYK